MELECECRFLIPNRKDLMPKVETHSMHGAYFQTTLKMNYSQLQMVLYSYGNGVSQESVDQRWYITRIIN